MGAHLAGGRSVRLVNSFDSGKTDDDRAGLGRFRDTAYLRGVLERIAATEDGWRTDPEAEPLMLYCLDRFAAKARKHGLEATDAMSVAFEAMRNPSARHAQDPWAVITTGVDVTFKAWQFAEEALTSIETARRNGLAGCRAVRMCERDQVVADCDPIWAQPDSAGRSAGSAGPSIGEQASEIAGLFAQYGWCHPQVVVAVEAVLGRLAQAGSRPACYEALRRDRRWAVLAGIPAGSWTAMLRLLLGSSAPGAALTDFGKGILLRLALGETIDDLAADGRLGDAIEAVAPVGATRGGRTR